MATIVNDRDILLQATSPRVEAVSLPSNIEVPVAQVPGLEDVYSAAKEIQLRATSQIFQVPKVGAISPTNIVITANLKNILGAVTWTTVSGTVEYDVDDNVITIFAGDLTSNTATIEASVLFNSVTYTDRITIVKVEEGIDAVVGFLSNESVTVSADSSGTIDSGALDDAGGTFYVFSGLDDKTGDASVTYSVVSQTGLSIGIEDTGEYTVASVSAATASATLRAVYNGVTIDKQYSIAKSRSGTNGVRGTVNIAYAITGTVWSDSEAVTALSSNGYGSPQERDIVTLYKTSAGFSESRFYSSGSWLSLDAYVNGNMLVTGTVAAAALDVDELSSVTADTGTLTVSGTVSSANGAFSVDSSGNMTATSATLKGSLKGGVFTGYTWPAAGSSNTGFYLGPEGLLLGNANNGKYFQVSADGNIDAPGLSISNGSASFSGSLAANVVTTSSIVGESVMGIRFAETVTTTELRSIAQGGPADRYTIVTAGSVTLPATVPGSVVVTYYVDWEPDGAGFPINIYLYKDGAVVRTDTTTTVAGEGGRFSLTTQVFPGAVTHTYQLKAQEIDLNGGAGWASVTGATLLVIGAKR